MPSAWLLWDRIRALSRANRLFQAERIFQDQTALDRIVGGQEFLDFSQQAAILDQTNLHINRLQRYKDYEQMDQTGEIFLALDLYGDEGSLADPERKHTLIIRAKNRRIKRELEELFYGTLLWDSQCRPTIRYLCKYGDCPYEILTDRNRTAVSALKHLNVYNFTRVETRHGDLVGFFYQDDLVPDPIFMHPWQVMHLRLSSLENIFAPYGRAIIDGGRKSFKQLRLMEDAALIYRITRAPEKRKFKIPVGQIPTAQIPEYLQSIARIMKRRRFYNPTTGTFDERYSPLIQEDDFFLPVRADGTGPDVDTLKGAENLDQIADIEYFKKKMIAPTKIPFYRVGIGQDAGKPSEKSLSQEDAEFAKAVQWVQREVATGLTKVAIVHLALRGYPISDIKGFELALTATSAIEELYRIETWNTRVEVMSALKELGWFPKEWIVTHFTDLTPDEIEELKEMEDIASTGGASGTPAGLGGGLDAGPGFGVLDDLNPDIEAAKEEEGGEGEGGPPGGGLGGGLEGGPEGELPPGELPPGEEEEGEEEEPAEEQFDKEREKRIITELVHRGRRAQAMKLIKSWAERLHKTSRQREIINHFGFLLESKELDGLSSTAPAKPSERNGDGTFHAASPNGDPGLLIEWSADEEERTQAINETYSILQAASEPLGEDEEEEITMADLPS